MLNGPGSQPERRSLEEIPATARKQPVLELGQIVSTPGALAALEAAGEYGLTYLRRHQCGDWGDLDPHDWAANDYALRTGSRILSAYTLPTEVCVWIITEWDRSCTTFLLPDEY